MKFCLSLILALSLLFIPKVHAQRACQRDLQSLNIRLPVRRKLWRYWGEYKDKSPMFQVRLYTREEADKFRAYIYNGRIVRGDGEFLSSDGIEHLVIDKTGAIYIFPRGWDGGSIRHSSLPVKVVFAGTIRVRNGHILHLCNDSGHYCFSGSTMYEIVEAFAKIDVKIGREAIAVHPSAPMSWLSHFYLRSR